ncbi:MAG TPA: YgiQ family radical SAM protein [Acholeplasmatales bacterium]|nr:YgiQ family radical SAM protein [Acholeplasmatales bacterium]
MFLPVNKNDMTERGWDRPDFVLVTGDAYVDHPSFGAAIISRVLDAMNFKVAILAQPRWETDEDFKRFGQPVLGFLVTGGNIDSIVNHYAVSKKRRSVDTYAEGGQINKRPDYAARVYSRIIRRIYPDSPIILGGIEASLRRLAHYDYFQNRLFASILIDSQADLIVYGMGETTITDIAESLRSGLAPQDIIWLRGTVWKTKDISRIPEDAIHLPSFKELKADKLNYARSFNIQDRNTDALNGKPLVEKYDDVYVIQNTASLPVSREYFDWVYELPYERDYHPMYKEKVPAIEEIKFSIIANRGCMGSCSFCSLTFHQGRIIQSRSQDSIVKEAEGITKLPDFKGYIHDVGGPTANFYVSACEKQAEFGACVDKHCLTPAKCKNLTVSHSEYLEVLRAIRQLPKVKKVFVRSGIRYDYLMYDRDETFFEELVQYHISGQLKVAPEHVSDRVLDLMQKPHFELYDKFVKKYYELNRKFGKDQFLVPYLMSSHPGSTVEDAVVLAEYLHKNHLRVDQVQDFYPTPGTLSTAMYYTEVDPRTMQKVYVEKNPHKKAMQRALIQYYKPNNYPLVQEALLEAGRSDLIGNGPDCLIKNQNYYKKEKEV